MSTTSSTTIQSRVVSGDITTREAISSLESHCRSVMGNWQTLFDSISEVDVLTDAQEQQLAKITIMSKVQLETGTFTVTTTALKLVQGYKYYLAGRAKPELGVFEPLSFGVPCALVGGPGAGMFVYLPFDQIIEDVRASEQTTEMVMALFDSYYSDSSVPLSQRFATLTQQYSAVGGQTASVRQILLQTLMSAGDDPLAGITAALQVCGLNGSDMAISESGEIIDTSILGAYTGVSPFGAFCTWAGVTALETITDIISFTVAVVKGVLTAIVKIVQWVGELRRIVVQGIFNFVNMLFWSTNIAASDVKNPDDLSIDIGGLTYFLPDSGDDPLSGWNALYLAVERAGGKILTIPVLGATIYIVRTTSVPGYQITLRKHLYSMNFTNQLLNIIDSSSQYTYGQLADQAAYGPSPIIDLSVDSELTVFHRNVWLQKSLYQTERLIGPGLRMLMLGDDAVVEPLDTFATFGADLVDDNPSAALCTNLRALKSVYGDDGSMSDEQAYLILDCLDEAFGHERMEGHYFYGTRLLSGAYTIPSDSDNTAVFKEAITKTVVVAAVVAAVVGTVILTKKIKAAQVGAYAQFMQSISDPNLSEGERLARFKKYNLLSKLAGNPISNVAPDGQLLRTTIDAISSQNEEISSEIVEGFGDLTAGGIGESPKLIEIISLIKPPEPSPL